MIGLVETAVVGAQHDAVGLLLVADDDSIRRLARNFWRFGDYQGYKLAAIGDRIGLQHRQFRPCSAA